MLREVRVTARDDRLPGILLPEGGPCAADGGAPPAPWYAGGLRFTCTQCGNCCGGAPGYVWVSAAEIAALAGATGMAAEAFERLHVRPVGRRRSLKERPNGDCEFLRRTPAGKAFCSVYDARPRQCRTWPFWADNLETPEAWNDASAGCPGINSGQHHPLPVIQSALRGRP